MGWGVSRQIPAWIWPLQLVPTAATLSPPPGADGPWPQPGRLCPWGPLLGSGHRHRQAGLGLTQQCEATQPGLARSRSSARLEPARPTWGAPPSTLPRAAFPAAPHARQQLPLPCGAAALPPPRIRGMRMAYRAVPCHNNHTLESPPPCHMPRPSSVLLTLPSSCLSAWSCVATNQCAELRPPAGRCKAQASRRRGSGACRGKGGHHRGLAGDVGPP